jgi:hypothetical protein
MESEGFFPIWLGFVIQGWPPVPITEYMYVRAQQQSHIHVRVIPVKYAAHTDDIHQHD